MRTFFSKNLPNTGPTGMRRIDYTLSSRSLAASALRHFAGLGDHVVPAYDLAQVTAFGQHLLPQRPLIARVCPETIESNFQEFGMMGFSKSALIWNALTTPGPTCRVRLNRRSVSSLTGAPAETRLSPHSLSHQKSNALAPEATSLQRYSVSDDSAIVCSSWPGIPMTHRFECALKVLDWHSCQWHRCPLSKL